MIGGYFLFFFLLFLVCLIIFFIFLRHPLLSPVLKFDANCSCRNILCVIILFIINVRSPYKLAPICAIKAAKVTKVKNLAPPQERNLRLFRETCVLAVAQVFYI